MSLVEKNKKGKVTHILGVEAELVAGILLLCVGALGVLWAYFDAVFAWVAGILNLK